MKKFLAIIALIGVICSIGLVASQFDPERWEVCKEMCERILPKPLELGAFFECMDGCLPIN